jgi:hypothetical protein
LGSFKSRRCLVVADGYYEWQKLDAKKKQPFYIHMKRGKLFAFAGLWDRWTPPAGEAVESCIILTTDANELNRPIHNRMPVMVDPNDYKQWLDPAESPDVAVPRGTVTLPASRDPDPPHGTVQSAQVIMDRDTGRSKGFGFGEMGTDQEAQAAIAAVNGKEVDGCSLTVNEARPREDRGGGGRGGFGGGERSGSSGRGGHGGGGRRY